MKSTGIIAEFNPFHNGHLYHMEETKRITGCDFLIVVMSGDYTQRGFPAIYRKYVRTRSALLSGADLVVEMPVFGSLSAAADFADCGVGMLSAMGIADFLSFGSECGSLSELNEKKQRLSAETAAQSEFIKQALRQGMSWPKARAMACSRDGGSLPETPNDILGVEYLLALERRRLPIAPVTLPRTDPGYHSFQRNGSFASASAARRAIFSGDCEFLRQVLPASHFESLSEEPCPAISPDDFSLLLNYRLFSMPLPALSQIAGMPTDLAEKLENRRLSFGSTKALIQDLKDRQYTYTRISRCLTNAMLGITREDQDAFRALSRAPWIRILGFRKESSALLSQLKKNASVPVITKTADAKKLLSGPALSLFEKNLAASELYRMVCELKTGQPMKNEYTRSLVLL